MKHVRFVKGSGGVGCSTSVATVAVALAKYGGLNVVVVSPGRFGVRGVFDDTFFDGTGVHVFENGKMLLVAERFPSGVVADVVLWDDVDKGLIDAPEVSVSVLVTCNRYFDLVKASGVADGVDGVCLVRDSKNVLRPFDVEHALDVPVLFELAVNPSVCRSLDAGFVWRVVDDGLARSVVAGLGVG